MAKRFKKKATINKKVRNATAYTYNAIRFKSKLEVYMYKLLEELKVGFEYEGTTYTIVPAFNYQHAKIRPITYTPDFVIDSLNVVIETKGHPNETFPIKMKLFRKHLVDTKNIQTIFIPRNQKQCREVQAAVKSMLNDTV
jgi:hypothetical protein